MTIASLSFRGVLVAGIATIATLGPWAGAPVGAHEADISITFESGRSDPGPYAYEPDEVRVGVGGSVTWENHDDLTDTTDDQATDHPTNCSQNESRGACPWSSNPLSPGETFSVTFPEPGTFHYFCAIHPYMEGTIVVGDGSPPPEPEPSPSSTPTAAVSAAPTPTASASDDEADDDASGQPAPAASASASPDPATDGATEPTTEPTAEPTTEPTTEPAASAVDGDQGTTDGQALTAQADDDEAPGTPADRGLRTMAVLILAITAFYVISAYRGLRP